MSQSEAPVADEVQTVRPSPAAIWDVIQGHTRYWTVATAVRLGVFAALAEGDRTSDDVASSCRADPWRLRFLLDALVGMDLLKRAGDHLTLGPAAAAFLVPGGDAYMGDLVLHGPGVEENWPLLTATLQRGMPAQPIDEDPVFWRAIARATFPVQRGLAVKAAQALELDRAAAPLRLLEIGAGAAPWTIGLLESIPQATAVVNDLTEVMGEARTAIERHGLSSRVTYSAGDYRGLELPAHSFDIVVLANVVRTEGEDGAPVMLSRVFDCVRPGGTILIADYFVDEARSAALPALLLGVTMVANTRHGATFTVSTYREWLDAAGFVDAQLRQLAPGAEILVARRPSLPRAGDD